MTTKKTTKYYTLFLNSGEAHGWEDVHGDYSRQSCKDEWDFSYWGYTHPVFDRYWQNKDAKIITTDGSHEQLIAAAARLNGKHPSEVSA